MIKKISLREVVVVEGRYDASTVAGLVDALVITTNGFSIFTNEEQKDLLRKLGRERGVLILTDSDAAGFRIRHYVEKIVGNCKVTHVYVPCVKGKESRKKEGSKEGLLGVEGMTPEQLRKALQTAGVQASETYKRKEMLSYHDLFELGISGGARSAEKRRALLQKAGLPYRLSKKALREVLSSLFTKKELEAMVKPVLFWDFHGTLTQPDIVWFDAVKELAEEIAPETPLSNETLVKHFGGKCLPWFSVPNRDTRQMKGSKAWWAYCEKEFVIMLKNCGFSDDKAEKISPRIREKILQAHRYTLYPDAVPTLKTLQEQGYTQYILSNNFPELAQLVADLGLAMYFNGVVVSGEVGYAKPRREIFEIARERAGAPIECYIIGDSVNDDILGGNEAGFHTILVHSNLLIAENPSYKVQSLSDILPLLIKENG